MFLKNATTLFFGQSSVRICVHAVVRYRKFKNLICGAVCRKKFPGDIGFFPFLRRFRLRRTSLRTGLSKKQNLLSKASFAFAKATFALLASHFFDNGKMSSVAILSMRDNVKHTKWKVHVKNLAKTPVGSLIFKGKKFLTKNYHEKRLQN